MERHEEQASVVVVGGGLAGLTAATYLARAGAAVTVFEKASQVGGRASSQTHGEYRFNQGAHALYSGGAASRILGELGVRYSFGVPRNVYVLQQGRFHPLPADPLTLLRSRLLSFADKVEMLRLFGTLPRSQAGALAGTSVQEWLDRSIGRPRVRQMLAAIARSSVYSAALELVSADVFVEKLQRSLRQPIHYVDGGWQSLVDGLRQAAAVAGARIVTGQHVEAVDCLDGRVRGVRLRDGSRVDTSAVIIATRPRDAAKLVDASFAPAFQREVEALVPAQLACLDVALSQLPASPHRIVQDLEQPRFLTTQSLYSRVAPVGGALIYSFKQLHPARPTDASTDKRDLESLLDVALPGWREVEVKRFELPRLEATSALPTARGGGLAGRPTVNEVGLKNLYLAGDWVGPEGFLIDASLASAREAAQQILRSRPAGRPVPVAAPVE